MLVVEAAFSVRFGVWFNVGVDPGVLALFAVPLIASIRTGAKKGTRMATREGRGSSLDDRGAHAWVRLPRTRRPG